MLYSSGNPEFKKTKQIKQKNPKTYLGSRQQVSLHADTSILDFLASKTVRNKISSLFKCPVLGAVLKPHKEDMFDGHRCHCPCFRGKSLRWLAQVHPAHSNRSRPEAQCSPSPVLISLVGTETAWQWSRSQMSDRSGCLCAHNATVTRERGAVLQCERVLCLTWEGSLVNPGHSWMVPEPMIWNLILRDPPAPLPSSPPSHNGMEEISSWPFLYQSPLGLGQCKKKKLASGLSLQAFLKDEPFPALVQLLLHTCAASQPGTDRLTVLKLRAQWKEMLLSVINTRHNSVTAASTKEWRLNQYLEASKLN